jgi:hypothetical protein
MNVFGVLNNQIGSDRMDGKEMIGIICYFSNRLSLPGGASTAGVILKRKSNYAAWVAQ